jgi:hypothetical protein
LLPSYISFSLLSSLPFYFPSFLLSLLPSFLTDFKLILWNGFIWLNSGPSHRLWWRRGQTNFTHSGQNKLIFLF